MEDTRIYRVALRSGRLRKSITSLRVYARAGHPEIQNHPGFGVVLLHSLTHFLRFTAFLETNFVNRVASRIALGESIARVDADSRLDAFKIYCDEGFHALVCADFLGQVEKATAIPVIQGDIPFHLRRLRERIDSFPLRKSRVLEEAFVIVSETLITQTLFSAGQEPRLQPGVKMVMDNHAKDEAHHHRFFTKYMESFWDNLAPDEGRMVLEFLPDFLYSYFMPDSAYQSRIMGQIGIPESRAAMVLQESFDGFEFQAFLRNQARATLGLFKRIGNYSDSELRNFDMYYHSGK